MKKGIALVKINFDDVMSLMPSAVSHDFLQLKEHIRTLKSIKINQKGSQYTVVYDDRAGKFANWVYLIAYHNHTPERKFVGERSHTPLFYSRTICPKVAEDNNP